MGGGGVEGAGCVSGGEHTGDEGAGIGGGEGCGVVGPGVGG